MCVCTFLYVCIYLGMHISTYEYMYVYACVYLCVGRQTDRWTDSQVDKQIERQIDKKKQFPNIDNNITDCDEHISTIQLSYTFIQIALPVFLTPL